MEEKRGQGMSLTTIILIIIGIVVLFILIWGFSTGWNNLWSKVTGRVTPSNVDAVVSGCQLACQTGAKYDFCDSVRTMKFGEERNITNNYATDYNHTGMPNSADEITGTCYDFSGNKYTGLGVTSCPSIPCASE